MTSSGAIRVRGYSWIKILLDELRLALRFRARFPEMDSLWNPLMAQAVIGSQEQHGCLTEHAP